ncbi:MAG: PilZ domain-containing protein [Deltaproteobacteria bacterium]|nr:PilZ domain-containing protein [Deltaproteobacteria bacterium]
MTPDAPPSLEPPKYTLDDLSWLRFPVPSPQEVGWLIFVFMVIGAVVLAFMTVQWWRYRRLLAQSERNTYYKLSGLQNMTPRHQELLAELHRYANVRKDFQLLQSSEEFENAWDRWRADHPGRDVELDNLRRALRMTVMNPSMELTHTRQLMRDLPVRVVTSVEQERLDVYCSIMSTTADHLLLNIPEDPEIQWVLTQNPDVQLIFWRERDGEVLFPITLEVVEAGGMRMFRAAHAFRNTEARRAKYRLSVNLPITFHYLPPEEISRRKNPQGQEPPAGLPEESKGRVIDLSFGGASFLCKEKLEEKGLVRMMLTIHNKPTVVIAEVLEANATEDGGWRHHVHIRGVDAEGRTALNTFLSREQVKRLREKEVFHFKGREKKRGGPLEEAWAEPDEPGK